MHYVEQAHAKSDWRAVRQIAVDETSARRGKRCVTNVLNAENSSLLLMVEARSAERTFRRQVPASSRAFHGKIGFRRCPLFPPTRDYDETVFNVVPYGDEQGETLAVLHNAAGNLGISLRFNIQQLPVLSLWKNTDTLGQGYVTGLEPGTSWAYNRSYQRALNRVPTIGPKEQRRFDITYTFLP